MEILIATSHRDHPAWKSLDRHYPITFAQDYDETEKALLKDSFSAAIIDTTLDGEMLVERLPAFKKRMSGTDTYARFDCDNFTDNLLVTLIKRGVDGYFLAIPSVATFEYQHLVQKSRCRLCSTDYGEIVLNDKQLTVDQKKIWLSEREALLFRMLLKQSSEGLKKTVALRQFGYRQGTKTHTLETHIYRLKQKLESVGVKNVITYKQGCYRLHL